MLTIKSSLLLFLLLCYLIYFLLLSCDLIGNLQQLTFIDRALHVVNIINGRILNAVASIPKSAYSHQSLISCALL